MSDPNNYHEFCRLLARLKSNYQLGELVKVDHYAEVIKLIAEFTVTSLRVRSHLRQHCLSMLVVLWVVEWWMNLGMDSCRVGAAYKNVRGGVMGCNINACGFAHCCVST